MSTIQQNLTRLQTAKSDIATAITTMGGVVTSGDGFEDFPSDILTIPSGGSATECTIDANFKLNYTMAYQCENIIVYSMYMNYQVNPDEILITIKNLQLDSTNIYIARAIGSGARDVDNSSYITVQSTQNGYSVQIKSNGYISSVYYVGWIIFE